ncbi:MAG: hypothetical protein JO250_11150 [Armatimonadetes bacterium]|nr:hypothetical protein [Armatimonadota bacterium]
MTNCILWNDSGGEIANPAGSPLTLTFNDIQGGYADTGDISADPQFVGVSTGDLHLRPGSPCLGAGATQAQAPSGVTVPTTDLDGKTRPTPPSIGAYD